MEVSVSIRNSAVRSGHCLKRSWYLLIFGVSLASLGTADAEDIDPTLQAVLTPEPTIESSDSSSTAEPLDLPRAILGRDRLRAEEMEDVRLLFLECLKTIQLVALDAPSSAETPPYPYDGPFSSEMNVQSEQTATQLHLQSLCAAIALPWEQAELIPEEMSTNEIAARLDLLAVLSLKVRQALDAKESCERDALREYHRCLEDKRHDCDEALYTQASDCEDAYVRELTHATSTPAEL